MSDFDAAMARLSVFEGTGYSNHPADHGGETYAGITRRDNPDWEGWPIIDALRGQPGWPGVLDDQVALRNAVRAFYRAAYWAKLYCTLMPQAVAEELFEQAVNLGRTRAGTHLQRALNVALRGPDLIVDGLIGSKTLAAVNRAAAVKGGLEVVVRVMNVLQGYHYITLMEANPDQEVFARGWLSRT